MSSLFSRKPMLDAATQQRVVASIQQAEARTSGEIRIFIEARCAYVHAIERAREIFANLGMEQTQARNAVIIYIALNDRQFALYGDSAIYEKAGGPAFWEKAAAKLAGHLKKNEVGDGLCNCITELGNALAAHFPPDPAIKKNELPDEIVFGK